ncbi:hypothetical protein HAZT_HAZT006173 [Hyalella azteca]|uniref:Uncharacterized protein n=1 Tax=Hyalella azteca TaxID=294128 RepID=A0A6A0H0W4_HYAAZ|nr:hypothetical protein HAZT_HAZT006173 [Hyalella azteca]
MLECLFFSIDVSLTVKRKDLDLLIEFAIRREVTSIFDHLLRQVSLTKDVISKVVLVGGSTRVPLVRAVLEEYFGPGKLDQTVNKNEAVAQGAALRAATLIGQESGTSIDVQDVTSFPTFGGDNSKEFVDLFERIPLSRNINITSSKTSYMRNLYERCNTGGNNKTFQVSNSRSNEFFSLAGRGCLAVSVDASGILEVHAEVNGKILDGLVMCTNYCSPGVIKEWIDVANKFRKDVENEKDRVDAETQLKSLVYEVKAALCDVQGLLSSGEISETTHLCDATLDWIEDAQAAPLQDFEVRISKLAQVKEKLDRIKLLAVEPKEEVDSFQNEFLDKSKKFVEEKARESSVNVQNHGLNSKLSHMSKDQFEETRNDGVSNDRTALLFASKADNRSDNGDAKSLSYKNVANNSTASKNLEATETNASILTENNIKKSEVDNQTSSRGEPLHTCEIYSLGYDVQSSSLRMESVAKCMTDPSANDLHQKMDKKTNDLHHEMDKKTNDMHHEMDTTTNDLHRKTGTGTRGHHRRTRTKILDSLAKIEKQKLPVPQNAVVP